MSDKLLDAHWFHWTGITPAISKSAADTCLEALKVADDKGITISTDLNYRSKLWNYDGNREEIMTELTSYCDIILGNEEDAEMHFGIKPEGLDITTQGKNIKAEAFLSVCDQMLKKFTKKKLSFNFTPHLTPMFRGILSTIYIDLEKDITQSKIIKTLIDFYKNDEFIKILKANSLLSTNDVINSNNCFISVCKSKYKNKIVIISAIDNLIKGGAGQAVQNLNMKFNFPLKTALQ